MTGIYKITNPKGKIYVGKSINIQNRKYQHKHKSKSHIGSKLYNSYQKYGWEQHIFEIIDECNLEQLNEREIYWKQYYLDQVNGDWKQVLFCELYDRGTGPRSEETKNKISKSNKGKIVSNETKNKKRISMIGKFPSEITKEKMRKSAIGKFKSESHKNNIKLKKDNIIKGVRLANSKPINQYNLEGDFIQEWPSIVEAKKYIGKGDIQACCKGKQKTAGGFIWKFKI